MSHRTKKLLAVALALLAPGASRAGTGAGELSLDRGAVRSLIEAALPSEHRLSLPVVGEIEISLGAPGRVRFHEGGVEAILPVALPAVGYRGALDVRYVPEVDRLDGTVRLVAERVAPVTAQPLDVDLAALVPPAELPRSLGGAWPSPGGREVDVRCFVHGVRIEDERLIVEFGVWVRDPKNAGAGGRR